MRQIHPLVRLVGLTFAVIVLFAACGGGDSEPAPNDDASEQRVSDAAPEADDAGEAAGTVTP